MVPFIRAGWAAVCLLALLVCLGVALPGGVAPGSGFFAGTGSVALLVPLAVAGMVACGRYDLAACAGAALAITGGPVPSCIGAGWVLWVCDNSPHAPPQRVQHAPDRVALLLLAAGTAWAGRMDFLLPGLCWIATRGLLGLSFSPRVAARAIRPFHMMDMAALIAGMALWLHLPAGGMVADTRWGGVLIVAGCLLYGTASWRALCAGDGRRVLAGLLGGTGALVIVIAGLTRLAQADDLPAMTACASRTFMLVAGMMLTWAFMARVVTVMEREAGPLVLLRLGGLGVLMPRLSLLCAIGLLAESGLPPLIGFSVVWMLLRLLAAMPHGGGLAGTIPLLLALLALGVGWAVRMLALVRMVAVMLCGRPRTPRCAGASDPRGRALWPVVLAVLPVIVVSIWPEYWLGLMEGAGHPAHGSGWPVLAEVGLLSPDGAAILHPGRLCLLVAAGGGCVAVLRRLAVPRPARQVAGWQQGAPAVPPWMVFGDPLTQAGPGNPARIVLDMMTGLTRRRAYMYDYARLRRHIRQMVCEGTRRLSGPWRESAVYGPVMMVALCMGGLIFIAWHG
ncbi:hydrogenase 4 subunit B [Komagataeibacter saccharivorans]|uniref:Hydrogenase 4 subunit B n=1 Tax=Komagataeibacter saccharivorans TaxID=265959 RepID=A0A347WCS9_9PROT|nr:hypothetical protein [Komagataeibacter saccharivorans]AXY22672.1 hydrogenase 4 subunit B [Komagataeibacter saccharivorans]